MLTMPSNANRLLSFFALATEELGEIPPLATWMILMLAREFWSSKSAASEVVMSVTRLWLCYNPLTSCMLEILLLRLFLGLVSFAILALSMLWAMFGRAVPLRLGEGLECIGMWRVLGVLIDGMLGESGLVLCELILSLTYAASLALASRPYWLKPLVTGSSEFLERLPDLTTAAEFAWWSR